MSIYDIPFNDLKGNELTLEGYRGKVLLIVNTATKCGLASQLSDLEELYQTYGPDDFAVLAFPCNQFLNQEPLKGENIENYCTFNFNTTYPIFDKIDVNGKGTHPLFAHLKEETGNKSVKWNYTKFLVDQEGNVVDRFAPVTKPSKLVDDIEALLNK